VKIALPTALLLWWIATPLQAQPGRDADTGQAQRLAELKKAGPHAALVLLPVQVQGQPSRKVAEVLGLVTESYGMDNLDAPEAEFAPPADTPWEQVPARLGEFLKQNRPKGDYVLYAQYLGEPKSGPTEVRFVVLDAAGQAVLVDRQSPKDADFKRTAARDPDPMGCSVLVADRLFSQLGWPKRSGEAKEDGKFARLWAEASGTPNEVERAELQRRAAKLKAGLKTARIAVYPTCIGDTRSAESAARLATLVAKRLDCQTAAVDQPATIQLQPSSNEQKRLWDLARAFRDYLHANPPEAEYALVAEYYINPAGGPVGAVHFVVCEKSGEWVMVDFQNNQWEDFQRMAPKTVEDCERLTVERLVGKLK
jgi:hypothetical protein